MTVKYNNLAGTYLNLPDGNLVPEATAVAPRVLIIGTASKGPGSVPYLVSTTTAARTEFGTDGNLIRGMFETKSGGAQEIYLYRIGATSASLTGVGDTAGSAGFTIQTISQDESAGSDYSMYYDDSENRIVIKRNSDDIIIYDNDATAPLDRYEVTVSGFRAAAGGGDIGGPSSFVNLEDVSVTGTSFIAGTDGLSLSRMELFEKLYVAYEHLKEYTFDVVIPMDVYLDDYNVTAQGHFKGAITPEPITSNTYPTAGSFLPAAANAGDVDALGSVYVEKYEGQYYFWWWHSVTSGSFSAADIYPPTSVGNATSSTKIDGTALSAADFHEVNFAYQLARFLHEYSTNVVDATGVIGVLPPESASLVDKARWLGEAPTLTLNSGTGIYYINSPSDDGSGLLGNKFMAGEYGYRQNLSGGGFIATETKFLDDDEIVDDNDIPVDLGKYISIVADYPLMSNRFSTTPYVATNAASYGGFYSSLNPSSAPTNKAVNNMQLIFRQGLDSLDDLAGSGYVVLRQKTTGLVIADAPTAALATSDWRRLSTVRIVKAVVDGVREAVEPFLGEGMSSAKRASLQNAVEQVLMSAKTAGYLQDFRPFIVYQTPAMEVIGQATIELTLIPAFELRQVTLSVSVSKSG